MSWVAVPWASGLAMGGADGTPRFPDLIVICAKHLAYADLFGLVCLRVQELEFVGAAIIVRYSLYHQEADLSKGGQDLRPGVSELA